MATSERKIQLAILDDYQNIAPAKFAHLSSRISITSYPETLNTQDAAQKAELIRRLQPYTVISTMRERTPFPADVVNALPNLKYLLTTGTRNRGLDIDACTKRGIPVTGTTGLEAIQQPDSTTQHTWALILGLARHIARDDASVKSGGWQGQSLATELAGKTLALLGLGKLGTAVARIGALAFNMKIKAWSSSLTQEAADEKAVAAGLQPGTFEVVTSKEELFRAADVLSVHYVLSDRSRGIVGEKELALLKPTALLVNSSRGPLIDQLALLDTLKKGKIRGAALDVFEIEPLPADSEWRTIAWGKEGRSEVLLSPHMGYVTEGILDCWYEEQAENLRRWLGGEELKTRLL
jgi:lactate dehydrogenase-like 2-hydroxyacid dehydrogenase